MSDKKTLYAIDGNSLLYRAFFAMRPLSTSSGQPTNAVYGLTTMLLKVLEDKPDYIAVAFDTPKPTFRHEEYDQYKAHRKPAADELIQQGPLARELIGAFNIPVIEVPGYEADDIIGAIARDAEKQGVRTVIVTGDLDALQLVTDNVCVMTTQKGVSDTTIYCTPEVEERFGLKPEQMVDYKGLKGDPSDNIPGVPGIGDKTATSLLKEYGTVENLLNHLDDLPEGKVKKTLQENREMAVLSKRLATIVTDLPVDISLEKYKAVEPDYDALRDLFVRLEFKSMLKRLPEVAEAEGRAVEERQFLGACRRINSQGELRELIDSLRAAGAFAMQCHTTDGKSTRAKMIGISFSTGTNETAYVEIIDPTQNSSLGLNFYSEYKANLSELREMLSSDKLRKYCHDAKLNTAALALRGVELKGVDFDTMLAAYLLDATRTSYEIGDVAFEQLSLELPGVTSKDKESADNVTLVCGEVEAIHRLKPVMESRLRGDGLSELFHVVELPLAPILAEMELRGIAIDCDELGALSATLTVELRNVEHRIYEMAGEEFNIGSPKQLQVILYEKMGLKTSKKTKTGFSTSAAALEELAEESPIVAEILSWRELSKLKSTYVDALPKLVDSQGRVHTSFNQAVTATGRLSSSDPNLQNIPVKGELGREIRRAFVASGDNLLLSADYSQIELRILAHVTGDPNLVKAFENDEDIHLATAVNIFSVPPEEVTPEMRRRAKTINFAVIYGMSDFTLAQGLGIPVKEARTYINMYFDRFVGVRKYIDDTTEKAHTLGYVTTPMGRRRYIPEINSANRNIRLFAERAAVNMPIQGAAADVMKLAMIHVDRALKSEEPSAKLLLQVHDELVVEVPPDRLQKVAELVRWGMEDAYELSVPLRVDVKAGRNWADMEEIGRG